MVCKWIPDTYNFITRIHDVILNEVTMNFTLTSHRDTARNYQKLLAKSARICFLNHATPMTLVSRTENAHCTETDKHTILFFRHIVTVTQVLGKSSYEGPSYLLIGIYKHSCFITICKEV